VERGEARLADGTLAGSVLTLDQGLRNLMAATGENLAEIWPVTSLSPAQAMGIDQEFGRIAPGYWADLVALDQAQRVVATVIRGRLAYRAGWG
jgi:N-acetylglucosamine-6-phosphate deacetylase